MQQVPSPLRGGARGGGTSANTFSSDRPGSPSGRATLSLLQLPQPSCWQSVALSAWPRVRRDSPFAKLTAIPHLHSTGIVTSCQSILESATRSLPVFLSFFPKPRMFFLSAAAWSLFGILLWFFGGQQLGASFGMPPAPADAPPILGVPISGRRLSSGSTSISP